MGNEHMTQFLKIDLSLSIAILLVLLLCKPSGSGGPAKVGHRALQTSLTTVRHVLCECNSEGTLYFPETFQVSASQQPTLSRGLLGKGKQVGRSLATSSPGAG